MDEQLPQIQFQSNGEEFPFGGAMTSRIYALESDLITVAFTFAITLEKQMPQLLAEGKFPDLDKLIHRPISMQQEQSATSLLDGRRFACDLILPEDTFQTGSWVEDAEQKHQRPAATHTLHPAPIRASRVLCRRSFKVPSLDDTKTHPDKS